MTTDRLLEDAIRLIAADRVRAHETIFAHRHPLPTAQFQKEIIKAFHGPHPRVVCEAFRKGAKSTIAEETLILGGALFEYKNALIIGASYDRACERLESVKHEFETNEDLVQLFGVLQSNKTWTTDKIVLANGVVIQAKGAGQSLRGVKYHAQPPDFVVVDDLEDEDSVATPKARDDMLRWLFKTLIAALTRDARLRFIGNRLDPDAVIVKVAKEPEWFHQIYPIMTKDLKTGKDKATWAAAYPLDWIYAKRESLQRLGLFDVFNNEYMCEADTPESRVFRPEHFTNIVKARVRTWETVWVMVDPARSVGKRSATTAIVVWSWVGVRLVVWECVIGHWLPDEIVERIFKIDAEYRPVVLGVEEDALNQFILQPLRQGMVKYGSPLPLKPVSAKKYTQGRGKEDFIKSQQPFFAAGEVEFAKPLPELQAQFLSFPKGVIDGPNALAYALRLRPGMAMYEDFSKENIVDEVSVSPVLPLHLVMNATQGYVTAALLQHDGRRLSVIADYVDEGDPGQIAASVVRRAQMEARGKPLRVTVPASHFDQWRQVGLRAALARVPIDCNIGGDVLQGREELRALFRSSVRGLSAVQVGHAARWTLNGFAGGYCRPLESSGGSSSTPEENIYSTLMAGIESFCALSRVTYSLDLDDGANIRTSADGRKYRSAMVDRSR